MRTVNVVATLMLLVALGCSNEPAGLSPNPEMPTQPQEGVSIGNGNYLRMEANLAEAVSLTTNIVASGNKGKHLLKITADKKVVAVLSGEHELISYKLTPTHIIAHVNIEEGTETCSLIAIPKVPGKSKVLCLNRHNLHCSDGVDRRAHRTGYDIRDGHVYFTHFESVTPPKYSFQTQCAFYSTRGDSTAVYSELRHWDGVSEKVETLFHTDPQPTKYSQLFVTDVFASIENGNLCIQVENNGDDSLFCRRETTKIWEKMKGVRNASEADPYLKLENSLLTSATEEGYSHGYKLDLATLEKTKRKGPLPSKVHFSLGNGGFIGNTDYKTNGILCVGPDGDSKKIWETDLDNILPTRLGNYAWYNGRESLRRVSLEDCKLDDENYFDRTKLLRLASLSWALDDLLRIDGTAPTGLPGSAFLTGEGELFSSVESTIALEHPIDLKW